MASEKKLPAWVLENVPDDAVWGETYVIARKEETQSGSRVQIQRFLKDPADHVITGKEIRDDLASSASPVFGVVLIIGGVVAAALTFLLRQPGETLNYITLLLAALALIGGVVLTVKSAKASPQIASIDSFEALEPYIEKFLTDKVFSREVEARKKELGETGSGYAGYFCVPARLAAQGDFSTVRQNFEPGEELRMQLTALAAALPEESRRLTRRK